MSAVEQRAAGIEADSAPLSVVQSRWLELAEDAQSCSARAYLAFEVPDARGLADIEANLRLLVDRYDVFRLRYRVDARGRVRSYTEETGTWRLEKLEWSPRMASGAWRERLKERHLAEQGEQSLRVSIVELPERGAFVALSMPRLSCDLVSLTKIARFIGSPQADLAASLARDPVGYRDIGDWLNEFATSDDADAGRRFWRTHLQSGRPASDFGLKRYLDSSCADLGRWRTRLPACDMPQLTGFCETHALSPADVMYLAIHRALSEYTESPLVARAYDSREEEALRESLGAMTRLVPLRLPRTADVPELIREFKAAAEQARKFLECFLPGRGSAPFDVSFEAVDGRGIVLIDFDCRLEPSQIRFVVSDDGADLTLFAEWQERYIEREAFELLAERIVTVFRQIIAESAAPMRAPAPFHAIGPRLVPADADVLRWFSRIAHRGSGRVVDPDGSACSHAALEDSSSRVAAYLRTLGIGAGDRIALIVPRSIRFLELMLGVLKAGAAYIPVDIAYPPDRIAAMLETARPALILAADTNHPALATLECPVMSSEARPWAKLEPLARAADLDAADPAYVLFTSGSTGKPKGVTISHGALLNHMSWMLEEFDFGARDVFLQRTSLSFDASVWEIWAPLLTGAELVLAPESLDRDAVLLLRTLRERRVTILQMVPSLFGAIAGEELAECRGMRYLFFGGEALPRHVAEAARDALQCEVINLYGPSECCIDALFWRFTPDLLLPTTPIGEPIANTRLLVVDREGRAVGRGQQGQLCIGGAGLFNGYLHQPELSAQALRVHEPDGCRYYLSGDWVQVLHDGRLQFLERMDEQIKLNGYRIELAEIAHVAREVSGAEESVCLFDAPNKRLLAFVTKARQEPADMKARMAQRLPAYMVPEEVIAVERFPLLANGKLDRKALLARFAGTRRAPFVAPRTALERQLAAIWAAVLGGAVPIGVQDNFFALGGDSIKSIRTSYLAARQGIHYSSLDLFKRPRIRELAAFIESRSPAPAAGTGEWSAGLPAQVTRPFADVYPATPMQEYMLHRYDEDRFRAGIFHPQQVKVLGAAIDLDAFEQAMALCMEAVNFRTRFIEHDGALYQALAHESAVRIVRHEPGEDDSIHERVAQVLEADRRERFDWRDPAQPLVRVYLLPLSGGGAVVVMSNLHAIQDGWGNVQFFQKVLEAYGRVKAGQPTLRSDTLNVCKEFSLQHVRRRDSGAYRESRAFWEQYLARCARSDDNRSPVTLPDRHHISLAERELQWFEEAARRLQLPLKLVLLSAVSAAVVGTFDDSHATAGVVWNGRNEGLSEPFGAMGLFWYIVPVAVPMEADARTRAVHTHRESLLIEPHAGIPLADLIAMNDGRPPFRWIFNYTDFRDAGYRAAYREIAAQGADADAHPRWRGDLPAGLDYFGWPLELAVQVTEEGLSCAINAQPGSLNAATLAGLRRRIEAEGRALAATGRVQHDS